MYLQLKQVLLVGVLGTCHFLAAMTVSRIPWYTPAPRPFCLPNKEISTKPGTRLPSSRQPDDGQKTAKYARVVVLDSFTADQGSLPWTGLDEVGSTLFFPRTGAADTVARVGHAEMVLTNKVVFDAGVMDACSELRYIGVTATGYNVVDLEAARQRGIAVTNVPAYSTDSVAQMVFAYLLNHAVGLEDHLQGVANGMWESSPDFCYFQRPMEELSGKVLVLVGSGAIGQAVSVIASAFKMKVIFARLPGRPGGQGRVPLQEALPLADYVSLHCPLTDQTLRLVNEDFLGTMKSGAVLVNTGRGFLLDEDAVAKALCSGQLGAAYLDVLGTEPPSVEGNPLLKCPNAAITPHVAWGTVQARQRLITEVCENVKAFDRGERRNRVES